MEIEALSLLTTLLVACAVTFHRATIAAAVMAQLHAAVGSRLILAAGLASLLTLKDHVVAIVHQTTLLQPEKKQKELFFNT